MCIINIIAIKKNCNYWQMIKQNHDTIKQYINIKDIARKYAIIK